MIGSAVPCCTAKSCKATPSPPPVFMLLWIRYKAHFNVLISPFQRVESAKSTCCGSSDTGIRADFRGFGLLKQGLPMVKKVREKRIIFTDFVETTKRKYLILRILDFIVIY